MPTVSKQRHFEIMRQTLALAEERVGIPLDEAASLAGVTAEQLRALLDPVLYLAYHTDAGIVDESRAFLLTEDRHVVVDDGHWLRSLAAAPPEPDTALRLLVAGLAMQSVATGPTPDLDAAVDKLRDVVATGLRVEVAAPPCLPVAKQAWRDGRSLRFRYRRDHDEEPVAREAVPYRVFCKWGHWYYTGRELDGDAPKQFRVDRMLSAELGDVEFDPPPDTDIPDWFDLSAHEQTVRVRATPAQLDALPRPLSIAVVAERSDGRVDADVTVAGERRLDYVLVCLDASGEVLSPDAARERRRAHAARLLAAYPSR